MFTTSSPILYTIILSFPPPHLLEDLNHGRFHGVDSTFHLLHFYKLLRDLFEKLHKRFFDVGRSLIAEEWQIEGADPTYGVN